MEPGGWIISMILGVLGAFLGGIVGRAVGLYHEGQTAGFFVSLLSAIVLVAAYGAIMRRRARVVPRP
jgi:uncharacterized membrane protein YeaQ/YmgE (transglycosylase-associated protein family)